MKKVIFIFIACMTAILTEPVCNNSPISIQQLEPLYTPGYWQPFYSFQDRHEIPEESMETPHFIIYYREGNELIAHQVAQEAESFYEDATSFMQYTPQEKTKIYIFPSLYSFAAMGLTPYEGFAFIINCGCPFTTEVLGADAAHRKRAMAHEFAHVLFFQKMENVSVGILYKSHQWIPEGIATYYSHVPYYMDNQSLLPPIVQYLEETHDFPESLEEITLENYYTLMYPLSASVIQFVVDQYGEEKFRKFLYNLNEWDQTLTTPKNIDRALHEAFGISLEELGTEWAAYIRQEYVISEPQLFDAVQITQPPTRWVPSSWYNDKILVVSDAHENLDIYMMNADGTGVTQLTKDMRSDFDPKFSPDGTNIAFTSRRDGYANIYCMNADGSHVKQLTSGHYMDIMGSWSPDGKKIAFISGRSGNYDVYIMNADGSDITRLTTHDGEDGWPVFSPDGQILFVSDRSGNYDLYIMNADGTAVQSLTNTPENENFPCYSPDGKRIVFLSKGDKPEICIVKSDGTGRTTLVTPPNYISDKYVMPNLAGYPVWSPDGSSIVFTMGNQIFTVRVPSRSYRAIVVVLALVIVSAVISGFIWIHRSKKTMRTQADKA